jgi:hypothetical protein
MLKRFSAENLGVNPKLFCRNSANDEGEWALIRRVVACKLRVGNRVALDAAIPAEQTPISDALIAKLKAKPRQPELHKQQRGPSNNGNLCRALIAA